VLQEEEGENDGEEEDSPFGAAEKDLPVGDARNEFAPRKVVDFSHNLIDFRLIFGGQRLIEGLFLAPIVV